MNSLPRFHLDRHFFASNASAYNAAWESYGWTAGLDRARAGRLEERVPWASLLAELADPPVLIDGGGGTSGIGVLPEAFLPLDGRLGFSVSGVILGGTPRPEGGGPRGGRARTATHTVLFGAGLFTAVDGFPQGLHVELADGRDNGSAAGHGSRDRPPGCPRSPWFAALGRSVQVSPGPLPELECAPDTSRFRSARLREVENLAATVGGTMGARAAGQWLSAAYGAVRAALDGGPGCVIASAQGDAGSGLPAASDLVRLVWLSLPLADRRRVYYSTTWLGRRRPEPCLSVPPGQGQSAGQGRRPGEVEIRAGEPGGGSASVRDRANGRAGDRMRHWAALVLGGGRDLTRVAKRMDVRGMSLFEGRSGPYVVYAGRTDADRIDVVERARVEAEGAGRWRGLGWVAAAEARRSGDAPLGPWTEAVLGDPRLKGNTAFFDGVVRGLQGRIRGAGVARLAVHAGIGAGRRARGLAVVVEGLGILVHRGAAPAEIGAVIRAVEDRDGREAAVEVSRIAMEILQLADRISDTPALVEALPNAVSQDPSVVADAAGIAKEWLARPGAVDSDWRGLLYRAWRGASARPGCLEVDGMHQLAWRELRVRGGLALADLIADGHPGAARLAHRLTGRDPDPPLSVYLALRRALAR